MRRLVHILLMLCPLGLAAQTMVAPCTDWLASVEESTQRIVLTWTPSADTAALGYHICTGMPCLDYDTVFGRTNARYTCQDHLATETHTYRLHVFDSARNVSSLTPSFGPVVLEATMDPCASTLSASWTAYVGMPEGVREYRLLGCFDPSAPPHRYDTLYSGPLLSYTLPVPDTTRRLWLKVETLGGGSDTLLRSESNRVALERMSPDSSGYGEVAGMDYDSLHFCNRITFTPGGDSVTERYTLWCSTDGGGWLPLAMLEPPLSTYMDAEVNPYDSLRCYRLSCLDPCGKNERYGATHCLTLPPPVHPAAYIPNTLLAGDPANGTFLPVLPGQWGTPYDLYIYNRSGLQVFHSDNPSVGWTPQSSVPQGVYTYILRCRFNDNRIKTFRGTVLLLK